MFKHDTDVLDVTTPLPEGVDLPEGDVRQWLDERAMRGLTESSRRLVRILTLLASDTLAGLAGIYTALWTWQLVSANGARPLPNDVPLIAMVACLQPLALKITGAYDGGRARADLLRISQGILLAAILGWVQAQLFGRLEPDLPNKTAYLYSAAIITSYVWVGRLLIDRIVARTYRGGAFLRRVLVVGSATAAEELHQTSRRRDSEMRIVGRLAADPLDEQASTTRDRSPDGVPYLGGTGDLRAALSSSRAHAVVVASSISFAKLEELIAACFTSGAGVSLLPIALRRLSGTEIAVRRTTLGSLLQLQPTRLELPQLAVKRIMDVALTTVGLIVIWPLLVLVGIAIKLDSPGPILFRQTRAGVGGKPFQIFKFRTMRVDADAEKQQLHHLNEYPDSRLFKIKLDPRVTRLGRLLRRTSIDELPQLLNVLRGDMSLVGPRPCVPEELRHYSQHDMARLFVIPGITGPWQVNGRNEILDFDEVVRLERAYIESWSVAKDLLILLQTVPTVFKRGAY